MAAAAEATAVAQDDEWKDLVPVDSNRWPSDDREPQQQQAQGKVSLWKDKKK